MQDVILDLLDPFNNQYYTANISWTPVNGTFDLKHYRVQVCVNRLCMDRSNTTRTSVELVLGISGDDETVLVFTESLCGDVGTPSSVVLKIVTGNCTTSVCYNAPLYIYL